MENTKDIKKIIKHKNESVFHSTLGHAINDGYSIVGEKKLLHDGTWACMVSKKVKWDNPNHGKKNKWWS